MRRGGAVGLTVAFTILLTASAQAGNPDDPRPGDKGLGKAGGLVYRSDAETVTDPAYTAALAACPNAGGSWRITGGGFRMAAAPNAVSMSASRPIDLDDAFYGDDDLFADDYWEASGDAPVDVKLTTYAICAKLPKLTYQSVSPPVSPSSQRTATDSCPGTSQPTGGGAFIATSGSHISSFYPSATNDWTVAVFDAIGGFGGMRNDFVCLRSRHLATVQKSRTIPAGTADFRSVRCPKGSHVTGGGIGLDGTPETGSPTTSYPFDGKDRSRVPDDGWTALAQNDSAASMSMTVYAICLS